MSFAARQSYSFGPAEEPYLNHPRTINDGTILNGDSSGTATAYLVVRSNGAITSVGFSTIPSVSADEWVNGYTPADWEVMFEVTNGAAPNVGGLVMGDWYACTTDRVVGQTITGGPDDNRSGVLTVNFRKAAYPATVFSFPGLTISVIIYA